MQPFTSLYTHTRERSKTFSTINNEESLTQQSDAKDADINVIVGRFMKTGQLPTVQAQAIVGNFQDGADFRSMLDQVKQAKDYFMELPAGIRGRFENDPEKFIEFASDRENLAELRKMGLANPEPPPPPVPEPMAVRIINADPEPKK